LDLGAVVAAVTSSSADDDGNSDQAEIEGDEWYISPLFCHVYVLCYLSRVMCFLLLSNPFHLNSFLLFPYIFLFYQG
jgi:hypothetical protein